MRDGTRTDLMLSELEVVRKAAAFAKYESQQEVIASLLAAFVRRTEPFVLLSPAALQEVGHMIEQSAATEQKRQRPRDGRIPSP